LVLASAANLSASTTSVGRMNLTVSTYISIYMLLGVSVGVCTHHDCLR